MSEAKFVFNEHSPLASDQVTIILVIDRKVFGCIADSLQSVFLPELARPIIWIRKGVYFAGKS